MLICQSCKALQAVIFKHLNTQKVIVQLKNKSNSCNIIHLFRSHAFFDLLPLMMQGCSFTSLFLCLWKTSSIFDDYGCITPCFDMADLVPPARTTNSSGTSPPAHSTERNLQVYINHGIKTSPTSSALYCDGS